MEVSKFIFAQMLAITKKVSTGWKAFSEISRNSTFAKVD